MKAVIIAGGLGTRMRPLTYNTPKPIMPVANIPFLVHQIEHLKQHGVTEVILNLHYMPEAIKKAIGDGSKFGVRIYYSIEKNPLGTAGAVKNAEEFFSAEGEEPLIIFNGDVLTEINITKVVEFHREKKAKVTITLTPVEDPTAYGLVITDKDGRVKQFLEKPSFNEIEGINKYEINAGIYVVDPSIFKLVPKDTRFMFEHHLFPKLLADGALVYGYTSTRYWIDIGNTEKYKQVHQSILRGEVAVRIYGTRERGGYWVGDGAKIAEDVKIYGPVLIGEKVQIGPASVIKDCAVLGKNVKIGENSQVSNSIILDGTHIGDHAVISDSILGFGCRIDDHCAINNAVLADDTHLTKGSTINV